MTRVVLLPVVARSLTAGDPVQRRPRMLNGPASLKLRARTPSTMSWDIGLVAASAEESKAIEKQTERIFEQGRALRQREESFHKRLKACHPGDVMCKRLLVMKQIQEERRIAFGLHQKPGAVHVEAKQIPDSLRQLSAISSANSSAVSVETKQIPDSLLRPAAMPVANASAARVETNQILDSLPRPAAMPAAKSSAPFDLSFFQSTLASFQQRASAAGQMCEAAWSTFGQKVKGLYVETGELLSSCQNRSASTLTQAGTALALYWQMAASGVEQFLQEWR